MRGLPDSPSRRKAPLRLFFALAFASFFAAGTGHAAILSLPEGAGISNSISDSFDLDHWRNSPLAQSLSRQGGPEMQFHAEAGAEKPVFAARSVLAAGALQDPAALVPAPEPASVFLTGFSLMALLLAMRFRP